MKITRYDFPSSEAFYGWTFTLTTYPNIWKLRMYEIMNGCNSVYRTVHRTTTIGTPWNDIVLVVQRQIKIIKTVRWDQILHRVNTLNTGSLIFWGATDNILQTRYDYQLQFLENRMSSEMYTS